jgi:hypothetical protein
MDASMSSDLRPMCIRGVIEGDGTQGGALFATKHGSEAVVSAVSGTASEVCLFDWERVIDFPHGSIRLLGSRKTKHLDSDPEWVRDKAYYPVVWDLEGQRWRPTGMYHSLLCEMSIFPDPRQVGVWRVVRKHWLMLPSLSHPYA